MSDSFSRIAQLVEKNAEWYAHDLALIDSDGAELNWLAYLNGVNEFATLLKSQGAGKGDRILIVAENCAPVVLCIFAATQLGAIAVPVNARMSAAEVQAIQSHANPKVVVYTSSVSVAASKHADASQATEQITTHGAIRLTRCDSCLKVSDDHLGSTAVILYTTGTTGDPKGVMLTHENLLFAAGASMKLRSITNKDRLYGALPLSHVFGVASVIMASAAAGACVQLETRFKPEHLYQALQKGITVLPAVPQMQALLMQDTEENNIAGIHCPRLRYVSSGAAPLDPAWKRKAEKFYGLALQNGYGMTESTAGISATNHAIGNPDISVGEPLEGIEVRIDTSSKEHEPNTEGEILTRGPHVMRGYFNNVNATLQAIDSSGYLRTGDIGYIDESGLLHISGRCKELIIRGGFNVYPPEVEAAINHHPEVVQCAVIGKTLETANEDILAFVQCLGDSTLNEAELKGFVTDCIAPYKIPTKFIIVDSLPAAATGKILKHKLLDVFADKI